MYVGVAKADPKLPDGRALERAGDYAAALQAYASCAAEDASAATASGVDVRYCAARVAVLTPQVADNFAGWTTLSGVRAEYRSLGHIEATRRIQAALDANPTGPAASELRLWLANELTQADGNSDAAVAARASVVADDQSSSRARALLLSAERRVLIKVRQDRIAAGCAFVTVGYAGAAIRGLLRGARPLPAPVWSCGLALLAGVPALMAWAWGSEDFMWFFAAGTAGVLGVTFARTAPPLLASAGTVAMIGLCAWAARWFDSLGIG